MKCMIFPFKLKRIYYYYNPRTHTKLNWNSSYFAYFTDKKEGNRFLSQCWLLLQDSEERKKVLRACLIKRTIVFQFQLKKGIDVTKYDVIRVGYKGDLELINKE